MRTLPFLILLVLGCTSVTSASPTVGVYYYPWWGAGAGGHTFNQTLRAHTTPTQQLPAVGVHNSRDSNVIAAHIDQSHVGNISMWSLSWWGPGKFEDVTIRQHILPHPRASELKYTIHYESTGRLGTFANPNYTNLSPDFQYLAQNIWSNANYMRIDGRPVLVMYLTREYFKTQASWDALSAARTAIEQEFGYDPYIIGDDFFGSGAVDTSRAAQFDAITNFDVYGTSFGSGIVNQARVNQLANIYANAQNAAESIGVGFVPTVSPGFNDTAVRSGHTPAARYLSELGPSAQGSLMEAILEDAVLPHTDPSVDDLIMVNSFNEWHEDTQIEASTTSPLTNTDDSPSGSAYTAGRYYEGYGNRYLEILRSATVMTGDYNGDGDVDADDYLAWTQTYGATGPNLKADGNRDGFVGAADFVVWRNAMPTGSGVTGAIVPEPLTALMLILLVTPLGLWRHRNAPPSRNDLSAMQRHTTLIRKSARLP